MGGVALVEELNAILLGYESNSTKLSVTSTIHSQARTNKWSDWRKKLT